MNASEYLILGQLAASIGYFALRKKKAAPAPASSLAALSVILFVAYNLLLPDNYNIRVDLFVTMPVLLLVIIAYLAGLRDNDRK